MKLCVDWEAVHHDWLASGLSKNRMQEGLKAGLDKNELLDTGITAFAVDAGDGFDWTPYLPWNFRQ